MKVSDQEDSHPPATDPPQSPKSPIPFSFPLHVRHLELKGEAEGAGWGSGRPWDTFVCLSGQFVGYQPQPLLQSRGCGDQQGTRRSLLLNEDVSPEVHLPRAQASWEQTPLHVAVWVPPPWRL